VVSLLGSGQQNDVLFRGITECIISLIRKNRRSDLATALYICDRIAIMYLSKIVEIAPTEDLLKTPLHPYARALIAAVPVPDPRVEMKELPIIGYVPLIPSDIYTSCRFYPRCPYADKECRELDPPLVEVDPAHNVACIKAK
jgi:peptide/nickel transport system ATP-binding protein